MSLTETQRFHLKKFIKELEKYRGKHTELVSVYIPQDYDLNKIINHLAQEQGTASNIKSASTRKNVTDALERMIQHLKLFKTTPPNGLVVFSGNVAEREGQQDFKVWSIEPPMSLKTRIYRCDKEFVLDILREMLETKEVYGLVVMDRRDANIALLKGKTIIPLVKTHSEVPGKFKAGGQCLVKGTLIQSTDGLVLPIENFHNPKSVKSIIIKNLSIVDSAIVDKCDTKKEEVYKIITKYPRLEIQASKDHIFFVSTTDGLIEKAAEELKVGDFLIMPEKIDIEGELQEINSKKYTKQHYHQNVNIKLPETLNPDFAQFLGYFIGDGCAETDRITFFEQDKQVALAYKKKFEKYFNLKISYRFRKSKNYHQLRFTSRPLIRLIRNEFPEIKKTVDTEIPEKILKSKDEVVAAFLGGLFDAEGYAIKERGVALGINNKRLACQIQFILLRFSILSSLHEYDNRANIYSKNYRYTVDITEKESLELFRKYISFASFEKSKRLNSLINKKSHKSNVRQIITPGKKIREIIEQVGYNLQLFPKVTNFFRNERMMSKQTFKNSILSNIKDIKLYKQLELIYRIPILPVKIHKIDIVDKNTEMVDISVKDKSFIANGIIVHNSAQRFHRIVEGAAKDHYKKVAEYMKEAFLNMEGLKGIIVGGPGPTKYDLVEGDFITNEVKKKIIAIKDLSYTEEFGLEELLEKSQDVLAQEEVTEEKKIVGRFLEMLATKQNMVAYGEADVMNKLKIGVVDTLLLSEDLSEEKIDEFEKEAQSVGTNIKIISTQTREGAQLRDLGKVAAILRYEVHG